LRTFISRYRNQFHRVHERPAPKINDLGLDLPSEYKHLREECVVLRMFFREKKQTERFEPSKAQLSGFTGCADDREDSVKETAR
jgi:hypothetical protein